MRRITATVFTSLDGVIQGPGGPNEDPTNGFDQGGWQFKIGDEEAGESMGPLFERQYDLLLGRRTYDIFASYWPYVDGEMADLGKAFTAANKYVLTHGDQPLPWENSHRLGSIDDVATVKAGDGPELMIWGSSTLYPGLLAAGLLDRLTLMIYPLTLGRGKRWFGDGTLPGMLKMVEHQVTPKGTIIASYEPAGKITDDLSNIPPPIASAREEERQAKMRSGNW